MNYIVISVSESVVPISVLSLARTLVGRAVWLGLFGGFESHQRAGQSTYPQENSEDHVVLLSSHAATRRDPDHSWLVRSNQEHFQ
jgi:hypothetical protein